jgi:hypothetical protein
MQTLRTYKGLGVTIRIEAKTRRVVYEYSIPGGMSFSFDLFNEIGAPYQPAFKAVIESEALQIELYDNPNDTYQHGYYERLVV